MKVDKLKLKIFWSRLLQRLFGRKVDVRASWADTPKDYQDMVEFLDWFDRTDSIASTVERGAVDWKLRFAQSAAYADLSKDTALEIGFGGGRLLMHAARDFKQAIGVDIHANFAMTERFLAQQGVANHRLLHRDDFAKVPDASVDFVYSFIVFQHFDGMAEVDYYLSHIERVLRPRGIAHIYYGKHQGDGVALTDASDFRLRDCSLFISPATMRGIVSERFELLEYSDKLARDALNNSGESVQAMVLFRRKAA